MSIFDPDPKIAGKAVNARLKSSGGVTHNIMGEDYRIIAVKYVKGRWWFEVEPSSSLAGWYTASANTIAQIARQAIAFAPA